MKEEKTGLTVTNWILSIGGILILLCLIILPPLFRVLLPEEEAIPLPETKVVIGSTTCTNSNVEGIGYIDNVTLDFTHTDSKITNYTRSYLRTYQDQNEYQSMKYTYGQYVSEFNLLSGYTYSANFDDDTSSIQIQEIYDLSTFTPTTVKLPGDEQPTAVTTEFEYNDDINSIKTKLLSNGYTCIDNN